MRQHCRPAVYSFLNVSCAISIVARVEAWQNQTTPRDASVPPLRRRRKRFERFGLICQSGRRLRSTLRVFYYH